MIWFFLSVNLVGCDKLYTYFNGHTAHKKRKTAARGERRRARGGEREGGEAAAARQGHKIIIYHPYPTHFVLRRHHG